jgi:hypothetical protein
MKFRGLDGIGSVPPLVVRQGAVPDPSQTLLPLKRLAVDKHRSRQITRATAGYEVRRKSGTVEQRQAIFDTAAKSG